MKNYEDLVAAIDFILKDKVTIAMAETPYVIDGPKVQSEAQAGKIHLRFIHQRSRLNSPSKGPSARPSWPADLNFPSAVPFASCGCSSIILPVTSSK